MSDERLTSPRTPHDALFRDTFQVPARAASLFRSLLPEPLCDRIDWPTLECADSSFIDPHLHPHDCDLLFNVDLQGRPAHIYLLLEHQSTRDHYMTLRMLSYLVRIWEQQLKLSEPSPSKTLPLVIPVLVSHAEGGWRAPVVFHELFDPNPSSIPAIGRLIPNFAVILDDLSELSDAALLARGYDTFVEIVYFLLRDGRHSDQLLESAKIWVSLLAKLLRGDEVGLRAEFKKLLRYLYVVSSRESYFALEAELIHAMPMHEQQIMTYGEELIQQGLERGLERGRKQGLEQGLEQGRELSLRSTLERLVTLKYGPPTPTQRAQLEAMKTEHLAQCIERVLTASTFEELLAGPG